MCKPASMILTRERVYWSRETDSHEEIVKEFNLNDDWSYGQVPRIVRVEIVPPRTDGHLDFAAPAYEWVFHLDQKEIPRWYDKVEVEERTRQALLEWIEAKVVTGGKYYLDRGEVYACGTAEINCGGRARVHAYDHASVVARGSSFVEAHDHVRVECHYDSRVWLEDFARCQAYGHSFVESISGGVIEAYGNVQVALDASRGVVHACNGSFVRLIHGKVIAHDRSTVISEGVLTGVKLYDSAVHIDRLCATPKIRTVNGEVGLNREGQL